MADKEVIKMLHDELMKKVDEKTVNKLKGARTKEEALSILEEASVSLDDEMLALVPGGDTEGITDEKVGFCVWYWCSENCPSHFFCPSND